MIGQLLRPARQPGAQRQQADAVLARGQHAGRRRDARHRDREAALGVGLQVQPSLAEFEPIGFEGDGVFAL